MKDYFVQDYHDFRAAQEDHAKRLTAAMIEYVESPEARVADIAAAHGLDTTTLSVNARRFVKAQYHRKRGPRPNPMAMSDRAREIIYLRKGGEKPADIAKTVGVSRQYVYDVIGKYNRTPDDQAV